jgi:hypothetical protein
MRDSNQQQGPRQGGDESLSDNSGLSDFFKPVGNDSFLAFPLTESLPTKEIHSSGPLDNKYGSLKKYTGSQSNAQGDTDSIFKQAVRLTGNVGYEASHSFGDNGGGIPMKYKQWAWSAWFKLNKPLQGPVWIIGVGLASHFVDQNGASGIFLYPTDNKITVEHGDVSFPVDFGQFPLGSWNHIMTYTVDKGNRILYINGKKIGSKVISKSPAYWHNGTSKLTLKALVNRSNNGNDISIDLPSLFKGKLDNPDQTASKLYHQQLSLATNASNFFDAPLLPTRFLPVQLSPSIRRQTPIEAIWFARKNGSSSQSSATWTCMGGSCGNATFFPKGSSIKVRPNGGIPAKNSSGSSTYGGCLDGTGKNNMGVVLSTKASETMELSKWIGQSQWALSSWIHVGKWGSKPFVVCQVGSNENPLASGQIVLSLDPAHHTLQVLDKGDTHKITNLDVSKTLASGSGWHHIMLRRTGAHTLDVLLDGHKVDTTFKWTKLPASWWGNQDLFIYTAHTQDSETHVKVDRVVFWNISPSTSTVQTYIQNTAPQTYSPPLKIYYAQGGKSSEQKKHGTAIIIGAIGILVIGILLFVVLYKRRSSHRHKQKSSSPRNATNRVAGGDIMVYETI